MAKHHSDPFGAARGEERAPTVGDRDANGSPGDRGFLGKSNDTTGLTQVGARYYDPTTGAFVSPDPLFDPANAKQHNAYAYSGQNPVTVSDPTGLMWAATGGGGSGGSSGGSVFSKLMSKLKSTATRKASVDASWLSSGGERQAKKELVSGAIHAAASTIDFVFNGTARRNNVDVRIDSASAWNRFSDRHLGTHSDGLVYLGGDLSTLAIPGAGAGSAAARGVVVPQPFRGEVWARRCRKNRRRGCCRREQTHAYCGAPLYE